MCRLVVTAAILAGFLACASVALGREIVVAKSGGEFSLVQDGLDAALPGDVISVRAGTYAERLTVPRGGDTTNGPIVLRAWPGERAVISGNNASSAGSPHLLYLADISHFSIVGLEICSNKATALNGGSAVYIEGSGTGISIVSNSICWIRGTHGMGVTVYGTGGAPISNLTIEANVVRDCEPATSEAITLNGNVVDFRVCGNLVQEVNNIGIDFIGGETSIHPTLGARNGVCAGNIVRRARSSYGGGYAAGIYVDGGRNIVIERNVVTESDFGMEIGAENAGWLVSNITVRSNLLFLNDKAGIGFGGYGSGNGRVVQCDVVNNTFYRNNGLGLGNGDFHGEIIVQFAASNRVRNNLVFVDERGDARAILDSEPGANVANEFDYNLFWCDTAAARFQWHTTDMVSFAAYTNATGTGDRHSLWSDPQMAERAGTNVHPTVGSPSIDAGDPAYAGTPGELDLDGMPRVAGGRVDIGAYEFVPEPCLGVLILLAACGRPRRAHGEIVRWLREA